MLSYNDVFDELQNYILNNETIQRSLKMKITNSTSKNEKPANINKSIIKKSDLFIPNQQDSLFWCFFISTLLPFIFKFF
jgi:hypothetical protein